MPDRLEEIRARLDAATPGDWPFGELARHLLPHDADLIAHAPADIAWLLDELDAATERIAILRAEITDMENADR